MRKSDRKRTISRSIARTISFEEEFLPMVFSCSLDWSRLKRSVNQVMCECHLLPQKYPYGGISLLHNTKPGFQ